MGRRGYASMRAAVIYQHRTMSRDRAITEASDALIEQGPSWLLGHVLGMRYPPSMFD